MHTTKKDFELFKKEVGKWITTLGLFSWDVTIQHNDELEDSYGSCQVNPTGRTACISLNINWDDEEPTPHRVKLTAFHEVCELLFFPYSLMAQERYANEEQLIIERHTIISTLERVIFNKGG